MSTHQITIAWHRAPHTSESSTYSRNHTVGLTGDQQIDVSAAVEYKGDGNCADPEQMFVSALASCHMLFYLSIAEMRGYQVESYGDNPVGYLEKSPTGGMAVTRIEMSPKVVFSGEKEVDKQTIEKIYHDAHKNCFIRNSIKTEVAIG